jgi:hypothetical protein
VALTRPLYLADVGKQEVRLLREGSRQLLPTRDRSGRRVFCGVGDCGVDYPAKVRVGALIYLSDVLAQDEPTQRDGAVVLMYLSPVQRHLMRDPDHQRENRRLFDACPVRASAIHVCLLPNFDDIQGQEGNGGGTGGGTVLDRSWTVYRVLQLMLMMMFSRETRMTVRVHASECCVKRSVRQTKPLR